MAAGELQGDDLPLTVPLPQHSCFDTVPTALPLHPLRPTCDGLLRTEEVREGWNRSSGLLTKLLDLYSQVTQGL